MDLHLEAEKTEGYKKLWNKKFPENKKLLIPKFLSSLGRESPRWQLGGTSPVWICHLTGCDSIGYLVDDNAARSRLWAESQALICFWSSAGSLAALRALGSMQKQSVVCFWVCCPAGAGALVMGISALWHHCWTLLVLGWWWGHMGWACICWVTAILHCASASGLYRELLQGLAGCFTFHYSDSGLQMIFKRGRQLLFWTELAVTSGASLTRSCLQYLNFPGSAESLMLLQLSGKTVALQVTRCIPDLRLACSAARMRSILLFGLVWFPVYWSMGKAAASPDYQNEIRS